ncbi:WD40/YVTN/BNR-like repeat-containing protein [Polymorphobacter fuscus]|uniref:Glycosyl hydrolase n=1 Tax=Sandarakinorhabdus fusca TaxID=1439888 RepID=A0A7C9GPV0_9SPHN|nr:glycosyl hydrolase [Polymorphobacter fuscus]KAB7647899.1 glycosyl hydrolase [Polymorphobacter fuscus]MQT17213.1 glycosyl hydrolase [Polymorphobacter fuscus]NJC08793.1 photosystem II stability/assembly factor-like uncharacterized protein [Polymorphobacter fuscus]
MQSRNSRVVYLLVFGLASAPALADDAATKAPAGVEAFFTGLKWRNIGPDRGGRSISAAGSVKRPLEYYFAAVGGGLWKTVDAGTTWSPVTDGKVNTAALGGVAVCEANPDVVYFTTGETQLRGNVLPGNGVWKSTDAGKSWKNIGLADVQNFSRIRIHPTDCNTAYVGGFGSYGAEGEARGVYKTVDGGSNWKKILYRDARTGAVDISIDPKKPDTLYAALWEAWRKPWGMSSGGPGSGLFRSQDGGATWTELTRAKGMPQTGLIGKIGVSVSPVDSSRVYAIVEHADGGMFVSDDGGESWTRRSESRDLRQRAFYYTRVVADPKIKDRVYSLNVNFQRSDDGGKTFPTKIKVPHGDNHDLWIAADDNQRMIQANDGGANVSVNGGTSWTRQNFPTAQMYRVSVSSHYPWFACGGQQDNSTICVPSRGWKHANVLGGQFGIAVGGGESGYVVNDPRNPDIFYAGSYGGLLTRYDHSTGRQRAIAVRPDNPMGWSAADVAERFQWTFPIVFDPRDPATLYVASQHVWRSRNEGQSWEKISPDLTRHDPATLGPSGGPITRDQTGVETYATIFALAPSRREPGLIWSGSDDGMVQITRDGGTNWTNVTPAGLPEFAKITTIEDSPHQPGTAYLTAHRFLLGDFRPYVLKTSDYGRSWTPITTGIPADEIARSIRADTVRPGLLYLGTERGVWVSTDDGGNWHKLQRNLPAVQVADLAVAGQDLVIATHGRSFWVMENIDVLRQLEGANNNRVKLFTPARAVRGVDSGVAIDYFLPKAAKQLSIEIFAPDGQSIQRFAGKLEDPKAKEGGGDDDDFDGAPKGPPTAAMKAGLNRFSWSMNYPGFTEFPGMILWSGRNRGVAALPGRYLARLTVDGAVQEQPFEIGADPRVKGASPADLEKRFVLARQITASVSQANDAVLLIRGIKQQTDERSNQARTPATKEAIAQFVAKLDAIESEIYQVRNRSSQDPLNYPIKLNNKLAALISNVESADAAPTDQAGLVYGELRGQLDAQLGTLKTVLDSDLPALNAALKADRLKPVERRPLQVVAGAAETPKGGTAGTD